MYNQVELPRTKTSKGNDGDNPSDWYVIYTSPKFEKKAYDELKKKGIAAYLPLVQEIRQWSDRKKLIEAPLFSRYLFVKINDNEKWQALSVSGALKFVEFGGELAKVKDQEINNIRLLLTSGREVKIADFTQETVGKQIEIKRGPFHGLKGEVVSVEGKTKILVKIDAIKTGCYIELNPSFIY